MKKYKIVFLDLDGTLINTLNNEPFPRGVWDMKLNFHLLYKLKVLAPAYIFIVTNQGGIEKGYVDKHNFEDKLQYISDCVMEYMNNKCVCKGSYTCENDKNNRYRKPNIGMLEYLLINSTFNKDHPISKKDMCMIGDASGKKGQFSDSDKQTAINFGIDYYDVDDFIKMEL
nr:MAG TPA: Polynucleotide kinase 3 phosphatase [Crassvirales sp.]